MGFSRRMEEDMTKVDTHEEDCWLCDGRKVITLRDSEVECEECGGTGTLDYDSVTGVVV